MFLIKKMHHTLMWQKLEHDGTLGHISALHTQKKRKEKGKKK